MFFDNLLPMLAKKLAKQLDICFESLTNSPLIKKDVTEVLLLHFDTAVLNNFQSLRLLDL